MDLRRLAASFRGDDAQLCSRRPWRRAPKRRTAYFAAGIGFAALVLIAGAFKYFYSSGSTVGSPSEWTQLTNFNDSAVAPALSPDGRMVAFFRGGAAFLERGPGLRQIAPQWRVGQAHRRTRAEIRSCFYSRWHASGYTASRPLMGYLDCSRNRRGTDTVLAQRCRSHLDGDGRVLFSEIMGDGPAYGDRDLHRKPLRRSARSISRPTSARWPITPTHRRTASRCWLWKWTAPRPGSPAGSCHWMERPQAGKSARPAFALPRVGLRMGSGCTLAPRPKAAQVRIQRQLFGSWHLWRQRLPDGTPEQITFGPTEEEGLAVAPDGRSLITSVGVRRSEIWIHDAGGDRAALPGGIHVPPRDVHLRPACVLPPAAEVHQRTVVDGSFFREDGSVGAGFVRQRL